MLITISPSLSYKYNSAAKALIDWWFEENIQNKSDSNGNSYSFYLEDVVFCNNRSVSSLGGWSQNGGVNDILRFSMSIGGSLVCQNVTDQFSVSNPYAKLKYPVGLLTLTESGYIQTKTGARYWLGTPAYNNPEAAHMGSVYESGVVTSDFLDSAYGVRPVVSLKPDTDFSAGDGTIDNPFVIDKPSENA